MNETNIVRSAVYFSIITNLLLAIAKWIAGVLGNSYAIVADAIESFNDTLASLLVLFGLKYANRPADENHPYGHGRIEPLITFFVVGILILSAVLIAHESIQHIRTPHEMPHAWTLIFLGIIILIKEVSYQYVMQKGKKANSTAIMADAWHHRSDAISSIAAFVGISVALFLGKGYESADDWAALVACLFILYNCYKIFRPALGEMMDEHFYDELVAEIRNEAIQVEGVLGTEKCYIRKAGLKYFVDLHALVPANISVKEGHDISHKLNDALRDKLPQIGKILIHIEPFDENHKRK